MLAMYSHQQLPMAKGEISPRCSTAGIHEVEVCLVGMTSETTTVHLCPTWKSKSRLKGRPVSLDLHQQCLLKALACKLASFTLQLLPMWPLLRISTFCQTCQRPCEDFHNSIQSNILGHVRLVQGCKWQPH